MENNLIIDKRFVLKKVIGKGGFSKVFYAKFVTKTGTVAIKTINKENPKYENSQEYKLRKMMIKEANIMRHLNHPKLIKFHEMIETKNNIYLIMELCSGGDLFTKLSKSKYLPENEVKYINHQVIEGLVYMHSKGFVHRDIKLGNIFFKAHEPNLIVKLGDFGLSSVLRDNMTTNCGTIDYSAPEILNNKISHSGYGPEIDAWSVGVLTYKMLSGNFPFSEFHESEAVISEKIQKRELNFSHKIWTHISDPARNFINSLLVIDPKSRLGMKQALHHGWLKQLSLSELATTKGFCNKHNEKLDKNEARIPIET